MHNIVVKKNCHGCGIRQVEVIDLLLLCLGVAASAAPEVILK